MDTGTSRVAGSLAFAALLTYLAVTGQLRWVLDAIVSLWLLTILLPILALGAFFFFAGQDILQSNGNKFVRESARFSYGRAAAATNAQVFNELFNRGTRGKAPSGTVVDVEAEVKDIE